MNMFSWEIEEMEEKRKERKNISFLKSKGWKVIKSERGIFAKHPDIGMTTIERALEEYENK